MRGRIERHGAVAVHEMRQYLFCFIDQHLDLRIGQHVCQCPAIDIRCLLYTSDAADE